MALGPVVLATGGTGGHVFPAEALAGELEARGIPFTLVTDSRGRQWQGALSRQPIHYIRSASPTAGSFARRVLAMLSLGIGLFDAWRALGRIRPSLVVGFGGYASVPTMLAARLRGLPSMLHEQNAVLGRANRMLAKRSRECHFMLEEGATPWQIDKALVAFGFPMGPYAVADLAGLDVGWANRKSRFDFYATCHG